MNQTMEYFTLRWDLRGVNEDIQLLQVKRKTNTFFLHNYRVIYICINGSDSHLKISKEFCKTLILEIFIGHVGWGISWYINGLLIPEINVVRGRSYTFVVEGGLDPEIPAKYHPFYITDDTVGGFLYKTPEEKAVIIYSFFK